MMANIEALVAMIKTDQNLSKVTHIVDENGLAVILENNKPRYIVVDFEEYEAIKGVREVGEKKLETAADTLIKENMETFLELVK